MKQRDSFFDNYKAFLILCVVLAHFLNHFKPDFEIANIIRIFVYFFHVPAFVFISGFCTQKRYKVFNSTIGFSLFIISAGLLWYVPAY